MAGLILFPALILIMYFVMIRPQQKRMREHQALLSSLEVGDDVLTESGIYGTVSDIDGGTVFILVADGVEMKVTKASISQRVLYDDESAEADDVAS